MQCGTVYHVQISINKRHTALLSIQYVLNSGGPTSLSSPQYKFWWDVSPVIYAHARNVLYYTLACFLYFKYDTYLRCKFLQLTHGRWFPDEQALQALLADSDGQLTECRQACPFS